MSMDATWVYLVNDPESSYESTSSAADDCMAGEVIELEEARVVRRFFAAKMLTLDDAWETREFPTAAEAAAWIVARNAELSAAADA